MAAIKTSFSLTELLVTLLILAILAALLFPAIGRSREEARRTGCKMIQGQYAKAVLHYANDYLDYFPTVVDPDSRSFSHEFRRFWRLTGPYLSDAAPYYIDNYSGLLSETDQEKIPAAYLCPSARISYESCRERLKTEELYDARLTRGGSYHTALFDDKGDGAGNRRMETFPRPSIYFFMNDAGFNDGTDDRELPYWKCRKFLDGTYQWGHGLYYNAAFLDGHVTGYARKRRVTDWTAGFTREFME